MCSKPFVVVATVTLVAIILIGKYQLKSKKLEKPGEIIAQKPAKQLQNCLVFSADYEFMATNRYTWTNEETHIIQVYKASPRHDQGAKFDRFGENKGQILKALNKDEIGIICQYPKTKPVHSHNQFKHPIMAKITNKKIISDDTDTVGENTNST